MRHDSDAPRPGDSVYEPGGISDRVAKYCDDGDTIPVPGRETLPPGSDPIDDPAHQEIIETLENGISKRLDPVIAKVEALVTVVHRVIDEAMLVTELRREVAHIDARLRVLETSCPHCRPTEGNGVSVPQGD